MRRAYQSHTELVWHRVIAPGAKRRLDCTACAMWYPVIGDVGEENPPFCTMLTPVRGQLDGLTTLQSASRRSSHCASP